MATEKEISNFLKENDLTEAQLDLMWSELMPINRTMSVLNKRYGGWKGIPIHLIRALGFTVRISRYKDLKGIL